jgi:hypothetical protein
VGLNAHPVVLVLGGAAATEPGEDLGGVGQPLREHRPDRVARADVQPLHRRQPAGGQRRGDQAEVAADVVPALQDRPGGAATGVHLGQRVQDRWRADAQPQRAGDQTQQVAGFQRGGRPQQLDEQCQLLRL